MEQGYSAFDLLGFPVAVADVAGRAVFFNKEYQRLYKSGNFQAVDFSNAENRLFICTDKGVVRCYRAQSAVADSVNIWSFADVTSFVNKKTMQEMMLIDEDNIKEADIKKVVEKNRRLSEVVELMESAIFIEGTSGSIIQMNNSFLKMISDKQSLTTLRELKSETIHELLAEFCSADDYFLIKNGIIDKKPDSIYTDEIVFKDGRIFTRIFYPLHINKKSKGYLWKFKDITGRKIFEAFQSELGAILTALEHSESVGLYLEYQGYQFINTGLLHLLRTDRQSIRKNGLQYYIESEGDDGTVTLKNNGQTQKKAQMITDTFITGGLSVRTVSLIDITDKVVLTENLKKNEAKFRNMFHNNSAVMLMFSPADLRIAEANAAALSFYGYTQEQMQNLTLSALSDARGKCGCKSVINEVLEKKTGSHVRTQQIVADGSLRDVQLMMTPIEHDGNVLMFVIVEDISDRVRYQAELESVNMNLQQIVGDEIEKRRRNEELLMEKMRLAEIGEMIGSIAHQWRQPLNTLGLLIQDVQEAQEFGELTSEYLGDLVKKGMYQIDYMSKTIDDFRDFFKPSKKPEPFDVKKCVSQVLSIVMTQLKNKSIDCSVVCNCGLREIIDNNTDTLTVCKEHDMTVLGYPNELKQVLMNIISNARDALADKDKKRITIGILSDKEQVAVSIEDTGGGIPETLINRIFDPYFTTKGDKGGTGIGLYMSKAIIEANMKGSLTVENTELGCRFTITIKRNPENI